MSAENPPPPNPFDFGPDPEQEDQAREWQRAADELRADASRRTREQMARWERSDAVVRSGARLDAALHSLEDRGLIWWDRASNTYDLHPVVRAYVFDSLDAVDRVQANVRVRDYFRALPPEDVESVTSVEDLKNAITVFRALVGAGEDREADRQWRRKLAGPIQDELGAHSTVIELLEPLRVRGSEHIRTNLAISYCYAHRFEEARVLEEELLAEGLLRGQVPVSRISDLGLLLSRNGEAVKYARALALVDLARDPEDPPSEYVLSLRLSQSIAMGSEEVTTELLKDARQLVNDGYYANAWFPGRVDIFELEREYLSGKLNYERLNEVRQQLHLWVNLCSFTLLQYDWLLDRGAAPEALAAALEFERLERNAGVDPSPALSAIPLLEIGRRREATRVVEQTLRHPPEGTRGRFCIGEALRRLDRREEALAHALEAYRLAWASGPPNHDEGALRRARRLIRDLGEREPTLPVETIEDVRLPFEAEVLKILTEQWIEGE